MGYPHIIDDSSGMLFIGAGYAGTISKIHWLLKVAKDERFTADNPFRMTSVERDPRQLHGGIAYGLVSKFKDYRLNLAAWRVTPFPVGEDNLPQMPGPDWMTFEDFIRSKIEGAEAQEQEMINPSRRLYGDYLEYLFDKARSTAGDKVSYSEVIGEVVDFREKRGQTGIVSKFEDGQKVRYGELLMATGFKEAVTLKRAFAKASRHPDFLSYPYGDEANDYYDRLLKSPQNNPSGKVLIIGTGLTASDAAIRLLESGYQGKITMISRRKGVHARYSPESDMRPGLGRPFMLGEPRPLIETPIHNKKPEFVQRLEDGSDFDKIFESLMKEFWQLKNSGAVTSEEILSEWEQYIGDLYHKFPDRTATFLLKYETAINVMRVGTTPEIADKLAKAIEEGRLERCGGDLLDMSHKDKRFAVRYAHTDQNGKHTGEQTKKEYDFIVNGIGNSTKYDLPWWQIKDRLISTLRRNNGYQVHPLRDGIRVDNDFRMYHGSGRLYENAMSVGVPVSGHMNSTAYKYPEKPGSGARLGAFTLNIQGILGGVLEMVDRNYDRVTDKLIANSGQKLELQPVARAA